MGGRDINVPQHHLTTEANFLRFDAITSSARKCCIMLAWDRIFVTYLTVLHLLASFEWAGALLMSACLQARRVQHSPERQQQRTRTCRMLLLSPMMLLMPMLLSQLPPYCPYLMVLQVRASPVPPSPRSFWPRGQYDLQIGLLACSDAEFCSVSPSVDCAACRLLSVFCVLVLPPLPIHVVIVYCALPCVHSSSVYMSASICRDCAEVWISHYLSFLLPLVVALHMASHFSSIFIIMLGGPCSVVVLEEEFPHLIRCVITHLVDWRLESSNRGAGLQE